MLMQENSDGQQLAGEIPKEREPSRGCVSAAKTVHALVTVAGMTSLGLLAMLLTHYDLEKKDWPMEGIIPADVITFLTAIAGKVSIVLYFNQPAFLDTFNKLYKCQKWDIFSYQNQGLSGYLGLLVNFALTVNGGLFWSGLTEVSFLQCADLLDHTLFGKYFREPAVVYSFMACCFYANFFAFPGVHSGIWHQSKAFSKWMLRSADYCQQNDELHQRMINTHRLLMHELKALIDQPDAPSPVLDRLLHRAGPHDYEAMTPDLNQKLESLQALDMAGLRRGYVLANQKPYQSPAMIARYLRYLLAGSLTVTTSCALRNVLGLSDDVWQNWGAPEVSKYGSGMAAYASMIAVAILSVYPMVNKCAVLAMNCELPPHVFSKARLALIISTVLFVGIVGGFGTAEQSALDGEGGLDMVNAIMASFLIDAFSIYMIMRLRFEGTALEINDTHQETREAFVKQQSQGEQALELDNLNLDERAELSSLAQQNAQELTEPESKKADYSSQRLFCCLERPLRRMFGYCAPEEQQERPMVNPGFEKML